MFNTLLRELAAHLTSIAQVEVDTNKPLGPCTSYRIGGPTAIWAAPRSEEGVRHVLQAVHATGVPLFILGRGSNLLVSDRGWQGVTLYMGENFSGWEFHDEEAVVAKLPVASRRERELTVVMVRLPDLPEQGGLLFHPDRQQDQQDRRP